MSSPSDPGFGLPDGGPEQQLQISLDAALRHGVYANFLVVSHTAHEFTLDFCQSMPGDDGVMEVVSRVKVAPTMVGRILEALNSNMSNYEKSFGAVPHVG
ncbi:MAG: DUF3467 domain-containing protein [Mycobacteriales bacterium]|nr:DUF3467 domain-containing protein [Frankia sp.]